MGTVFFQRAEASVHPLMDDNRLANEAEKAS